MFVAEALYKFSKEVLEAQNKKDEEEEPLFKDGEGEEEGEKNSLKRGRDKQQEEELAKEGEDRFRDKNKEQ